jgi:aspartyl-tRNA(Asn)/glutamyl-tRNA(Gln) amidotransferase subunit A
LKLPKLSEDVRSGAVTPTELVHRCLEKIRKLNPVLNVFITVLEEDALKQAAERERELRAGYYRGPLHGIPVSLKDIIYVGGVRCTAGSKILSNHVAPYDSTVTKKLKEAGAVLIGTNNLHEFASGVTSINPHYGPVRNPWNTEYIAGGSSGGSAAAVAAGLTPISLGTDTSGSVRIPASLCGVVGLKPSYGRVSKHGVIPLSWSLDHVGVFANSVEEAASCLHAIAGYDPEDESTVYAEVPDYVVDLDVGGMRVVYFREMDRADEEVGRLFKRFVSVLEGLGVVVEEAVFEYGGRVRESWAPIRLGEAAAFHDKWFRERPMDYGADVREMIERGRAFSAIDYVKAQRLRHEITRTLLKTLDRYHAIISPTTPTAAVKIAEAQNPETYQRLTENTILYNLAGLPAVSIPIGLTDSGLPVGAQIAGRLFDENTVLRLAYHVQQKIGVQRP